VRLTSGVILLRRHMRYWSESSIPREISLIVDGFIESTRFPSLSSLLFPPKPFERRASITPALNRILSFSLSLSGVHGNDEHHHRRWPANPLMLFNARNNLLLRPAPIDRSEQAEGLLFSGFLRAAKPPPRNTSEH